ncbi:MAG: hypothetical protein MUE84_10425 [Hyphomonas sp.]|nr:hypothetical protein [Hyphomonas sp.]
MILTMTTLPVFDVFVDRLQSIDRPPHWRLTENLVANVRRVFRQASASAVIAALLCVAVSTVYAQPSEQARERTRAALIDEAAEAKHLSERLWAIARTYDSEFWLGTMYNEHGVVQAECYVLGKMVGQPAAVQHLRPSFAEPFRPSNSGEARDLRLRGVALTNFASVVKGLSHESYEEHAFQWNLDCIGRLKIRGRSIDTSGFATFYRIRGDGKALQVLGDIRPGFAERLRDALERNPAVTTVALGSGGGSVREAVLAGQYIRSRGLSTTLWNYCYSACPLVFVGGKDRMIWSPYPGLGFHQIYDKSGAVSLDSPAYRSIAAYLREMGVDPAFVLRAMWVASPNDMNVVRDPQQLCRARVATWIQRACSSGE